MFPAHNERSESRLTPCTGRAENHHTYRTHSGKPGGKPPNHSAIAPQVHVLGIDLAGFPARRFKVPALHPTFRLRQSLTLRSRAVAHKRNLWRPGMATAKNGKAATTPGGALRSGGHPGAAQPPLDLSLGHIGTKDSFGEAALLVEDIGPFRVVFNPETRQAQVTTDRSAFANREERRAAEREFRRTAVRIATETGFDVSFGRAP
jgi:hypothetical protein